MRNILPIIAAFILLSVFILGQNNTSSVSAVTAGHVVISEVQIGSSTDADDEFVELYNPTTGTIDLTGWRLTRKTQSGATQENLVASLTGSIVSHGYMLIAPPEYDGAVSEDIAYSTASRIATNNTVILYSDAGTTVVDKVGMGTAVDVETTATSVPDASLDQSIERKPGETSPTGGNGEDTDNNSADFALRTTAEPQNAASATETPAEVTPSVTPTPTEGPTPTVTLTPTEGPTSTPTPTPTTAITETPTPTVTSTPTPTGIPTSTPTPTPTEIPTSTPTPTQILTSTPTQTSTPTPTTEPTATPTPTEEPTETPTPTPTEKPGKVLGVFPIGKGVLICRLTYRPLFFGWGKLYLPKVTCERVENHGNNTGHDDHTEDH